MQAAQVTTEEYLMAERSVSPLKVVGYEGAMGAALTMAVLLPLLGGVPADAGGVLGALREDSVDTLAVSFGGTVDRGLLSSSLLPPILLRADKLASSGQCV